MPSCSFTDADTTADGFYQICTCGKHAWSTRCNRIVKARPNEAFVFTDGDRRRYAYSLPQRCETSLVFQRSIKALLFALWLVAIAFLCVDSSSYANT